jgi:formylglycine-generating enzyme required for sulfatase activity
VRALVALAPHLSPEQAADALAAAKVIGDEGSRVEALVALAPHLSPEQARDALAAAEAIGHAGSRFQALRALAPHLSPELKDKTLAHALAAVMAAERQERLWRPAASALWSPSRPTLLVASLVGVVVLGAIAARIITAPSTPPPFQKAEPPDAQLINAALSPDQERVLNPKGAFKECSNCPQMIVVPAGSFTMGLRTTERVRAPDESPQHTVTIARQFAVGQFELTFDEWDACVADGGCNGYKPSDQGWGRGRRPVINVSWDDAKAYVAWLSKKTGKTYRLLTEAEYEYAARAGTQGRYPWGNDIGKKNANCDGCGSQWDNKQTAPVGSFRPNDFSLYDMVGNVWAWTEDCYHGSYNGAPGDGSAWTSGDCSHRVMRGGSWLNTPENLRSARRGGDTTDSRTIGSGFRVGRTLLAP